MNIASEKTRNTTEIGLDSRSYSFGIPNVSKFKCNITTPSMANIRNNSIFDKRRLYNLLALVSFLIFIGGG